MKKAGQIAIIVAYSAVLLFMLRFGARTFPGRYSDSLLLNALLNNSGIFTDLGYNIVLVAAAARMVRVFTSDAPGLIRRRHRFLGWVQAAAIALAVAIILYGLWWAALLERLPWQPDGSWWR